MGMRLMTRTGRASLLAAVVVAVAGAACSSGTTPSTPTVAARTPSSVATTATATATSRPSPSATPSTAAPPVPTLGGVGVIDSRAQCFRANDAVRTLDLPRQILSISPADVKDGEKLEISAIGYRPRTALEVRVFAPGTNRISQPLAQTLTDEGGRATVGALLPSVKVVNQLGDDSIPVCLGVVLWSPAEAGAAALLVVPSE